MPPKIGTRLIAASVFYNNCYYLSGAEHEDWFPVVAYGMRHGHEQAVRYAVYEADLGYWRRRESNWQRMMAKERDENVPCETRISDLIAAGTEHRQSITMNHPASLVFVEWAARLLRYLGYEGTSEAQREEARCHDNLCNLPCEDFVCSGARKHLGLKWGGTDWDNQNCEGIAAKWLREQVAPIE
jgi:hypothetical protein